MTDKDKLEKAVKLADAMYYAAQYLTTDASRLRRAMDAYHQFIITEYNKQEPASEDLEKEMDRYFETMQVLEHENIFEDTFQRIAKHFVQWQKEQIMKDAAEGKVVAVRNVMSDRSHTYPWIELEAQLSKNDKVKVIIIKE